MFGKKEYSREAFEEAQKREQNAEDIALNESGDLKGQARNIRHSMQEAANINAERRYRTGIYHMDPEKLALERRANEFEEASRKVNAGKIRGEARKKLDALMKTGHKEALKLNEEYNELSAHATRLRLEAEQAESNLVKFEREKLHLKSPRTSE